jgi:hypothetical protein
MKLELNEEEYRLLVGLLESRIEELHPEIRRSRERDFKERLKHELDCLVAVRERLKEDAVSVR